MQNAVPEGTAGMLVILNMDLNEVYKMIDGNWKLANLSFVKLMERPGN